MVREFDAVRIGGGTPAKRVPLFTLDVDGEEREYTIPEKVPPSVTLDMLDRMAAGDPSEQVISDAVIEVMGGDAWDALLNAARDGEATQEQVGQVMTIVEDMLMAAQQETVGKSRRARRRSAG